MSDRRCLLVGHGQIDLYSAPTFQISMLDAIDEGETNLVVDLSDVDFIDSTGLGVLVGISKRLKLLNGSLAIVLPGDSMRRAFELSGLTRQFEIHASRAELAPAD